MKTAAVLFSTAVLGIVLTALLGGVSPARAHGFSSVVYASLTAPRSDIVRAELGLEYDLMLVSVATSEHDDPLYREGQRAWETGDFHGMVSAAQSHVDSIGDYVLERFTVSTATGEACAGEFEDAVTVDLRDEVPYATVAIDFTCPEAGGLDPGHVVSSSLFPDEEGYVRDTTTIVVYNLDGKSGTASLTASAPSFSTEQAWYERAWQFFVLGAEHLLGGLDHLLFLIAVIIGSRRLREVVLAATAFTVAHSITFILAALGVVSPPAIVVEPAIALSIAAVAVFYLWRLFRRRSHADDLTVTGTSHLELDRAGWARVAVVFAFGLVHGLGFAGALGIREAFSWPLLVSLLIFNVGIEAMQLAIILVVFPLLMLLRRRAHPVALWLSGLVTAAVFVAGMIWFVQRLIEG